MEIFINVTTMLKFEDIGLLYKFKVIGNYIALEVFTAVCMKTTVFWDVTPCSPVKVHQCFRGTHCVHLQGQRESQKNETPILARFLP
jgi:hypothetical protein